MACLSKCVAGSRCCTATPSSCDQRSDALLCAAISAWDPSAVLVPSIYAGGGRLLYCHAGKLQLEEG